MVIKHTVSNVSPHSLISHFIFHCEQGGRQTKQLPRGLQVRPGPQNMTNYTGTQQKQQGRTTPYSLAVMLLLAQRCLYYFPRKENTVYGIKHWSLQLSVDHGTAAECLVRSPHGKKGPCWRGGPCCVEFARPPPCVREFPPQ